MGCLQGGPSRITLSAVERDCNNFKYSRDFGLKVEGDAGTRPGNIFFFLTLSRSELCDTTIY